MRPLRKVENYTDLLNFSNLVNLNSLIIKRIKFIKSLRFSKLGFSQWPQLCIREFDPGKYIKIVLGYANEKKYLFWKNGRMEEWKNGRMENIKRIVNLSDECTPKRE